MQIRLNPKHEERLQEVAKQHHRSTTAEANLAIEMYLDAHRVEAKKGPLKRQKQ